MLKHYQPWEKWFAWFPVKVDGNWVWLKIIFRRAEFKTYATYDDWNRYEYGTLFSVIGS